MEHNDKSKRKSLLEVLEKNREEIKKAREVIFQETLKYKSKIKKYEDLIDAEKTKAKNITDIIVKVGLETLVEEIAKDWGINVDDLNVDVEFENTSLNGKYDKKKFLEYQNFHCFIQCGVRLKITISSKLNQKFLIIKRKAYLNEIQKNGQELKDFLDVETKRDGQFKYTNFVCSNYKNLILEYELGELLTVNYDPLNKLSEIILDIYESGYEKENCDGK